MRRILAFLLCSCILFSCVPALAADEPDPAAETPAGAEPLIPEDASEMEEGEEEDPPADQSEAGPGEDEEQTGSEDQTEEEEIADTAIPAAESAAAAASAIMTAAVTGEPVLLNGAYQLATADDLNWFAKQVTAGNVTINAVLTADIKAGASCTSIGTVYSSGLSTSRMYQGTFDGNGHTISNWTCTLFTAMYKATVKDLTLENVSVTGMGNGALASYAGSCTLENITVSGRVQSTVSVVGGFVGWANACTFEHCVNDADVSAVSCAGGLIGRSDGANKIRDCANTGTITGTNATGTTASYAVGGLIGYIFGSSSFVELDSCYNAGEITGACLYLGGLVGYADSEKATRISFLNCYNAGAVSSTRTTAASPAHVGGLVGCISNIYYYIYFSYNAGQVTAEDSSALKGGLCGSVQSTAASFSAKYAYSQQDAAERLLGNDKTLTTFVTFFNESEDLMERFRTGAYATATVDRVSYYYYMAFVENPEGGLPVLDWQLCPEHHFVDVIDPPTCLDKGYTWHVCADCGYGYQDRQTAVKATGHSYDSGVITTEATCIETGVLTYTCVNCGDTKTETIPLQGHAYDEGEVTEPTCLEEGYTTYTCVDCGHSYEGDVVPALGHLYGEPVEVTAPTCTEDGSETYLCEREGCDEESEGHTDIRTLPATGHNFVNGFCTNEGCDAVEAENCFWLEIATIPEDAVVTLTGPDGETVEPAGETGRWILDQTAAYQYSITAEHFQETAGEIQGIDEAWTRGEDGLYDVAVYTMTAVLQPDVNLVTFQGSNVTALIDGEEAVQTEVPYGENLDFQLQTWEGYWVSKVSAVVERSIQCDDVWNGDVADEFDSGSGTSSDPYIIRTSAQLAHLAYQVNTTTERYEGVYFRLEADLDLNNLPWTPIGIRNILNNLMQPACAFQGYFDGGGHVIRNLYVDNDTTAMSGRISGGLFCYVTGGRIENLGLAQCTVKAKNGASILAGELFDGAVAENCWATGAVTTQNDFACGLVGRVWAGCTVKNCWSGVSVTATGQLARVGGIAGEVYGTLLDCWNVGAVTAEGSNSCAGGVAGYIYTSDLENYYNGGRLERCYNSGVVTSKGAFQITAAETGYNMIFGTGGIAGVLINNSYKGEETILRECYNSGSVKVNAGRAGGIVGNIGSVSAAAYIELSSCYNTGSVAMVDSAGYAGGLAGRAYGLTQNYVVFEKSYTTGSVTGSLAGALAGSAEKISLSNCYALEGTARSLFSQKSSVTDSASAFYPQTSMQEGEFLVLLGDKFNNDLTWSNDGFPVLTWEADRPDVFGDYEELPVLYDEESGTYTVEQVTQPVMIRVEARTSVSQKKIVFDVQPDSMVSGSLRILVQDSTGAEITPESGTVNAFTLTVGETYTYTITADGYETVRDTLEVTESSSYVVRLTMRESVPSHTVTVRSDNQKAGLISAATGELLGGAVQVIDAARLDFYVMLADGYELASIRLSGKDSALDVWDGRSADITWYNGQDKAFTITTAAQLAGLSQLVRQGKDFAGVTLRLDADLDMSAGNLNPIGYAENALIVQNGLTPTSTVYPFRGTFNGNGHTVTVAISGANNGYNRYYLGLFGYVSGAVVENLTVAGSVQGHTYVAGIVGVADHSVIRNCLNMANVNVTSSMGAGVVACARGDCQIVNCYNGGEIAGPMNIAGVVGKGYPSFAAPGGSTETGTPLVRGCQNAGTIRTSEEGHCVGAGGITIGDVALEACSNQGEIYSAGSWIGGLSALNVLWLTDCYNAGTIYCTKSKDVLYGNSHYVGGLVGSSNAALKMENCYNAGEIIYSGGGSGFTGALIGYMSGGTLSAVSNNYWLSGTWEEPISTKVMVINFGERQIKEVDGQSLMELYSALGSTNWKSDVTEINHGYPVLRDTPDLSTACVLEEMEGGLYRIPAVYQDVTIHLTAVPALKGLTLDKDALALMQSEMYQLTASLDGEDAGSWSIDWSSSDPAVALVDSAGCVMAVAPGTAVITATAGSVSASCTLTVTERQGVLDITVNSGGLRAVVKAPEDGWTEGENTFTVSYELACVVAVSYDGGVTYTRLEAAANGDGTYSFTAHLTEGAEIAVVVKGDTNGDGELSIEDAIQLARIISDGYHDGSLSKLTGDVNEDSELSIEDAIRLARAVSGYVLAW